MPVVLEARGISVRRASRRVLHPVDLEVRAGRSHALLGPNGAGKTTTLSVLVGLLTPDAGHVTVQGIDIRRPEARTLIGYAPDDLALPTALTGFEYLRLHDRLRRRDDRARATDLCRLLQLQHALGRQMSEYSHGMRRKIQFVAATMHDPLVLLLDEPYRGLDPATSAIVRRYLAEFIAAGRSLVVATHDLLRAERDCEHLWLIDDGALVAEGAPSDVVRQGGGDDLEAAFASLTRSRLRPEDERDLLAGILPPKESTLP